MISIYYVEFVLRYSYHMLTIVIVNFVKNLTKYIIVIMNRYYVYCKYCVSFVILTNCS